MQAPATNVGQYKYRRDNVGEFYIVCEANGRDWMPVATYSSEEIANAICSRHNAEVRRRRIES